MKTSQLPAVIKRAIPNAKLPVNYEAARTAIAACARIDEVKEWHDRAAAIASYARQAGDNTMRDAAIRIQLRAKERIGELLFEGNDPISFVSGRQVETAKRHGLSEKQRTEAVQIVRVPKMRRDELIEQSPPAPQAQFARESSCNYRRAKGDPTANQLHQLLLNKYAYKGLSISGLAAFLSDANPKELAKLATEHEVYYLRTLARKIVEWFDTFEQQLPKVKE
jgi:hypothetical protein